MHFPYLTPVMSILVGMSVVGVLNASIMGHSRLIFAGARNGHAPPIFGMLHVRYLTPWPSIIIKVKLFSRCNVSNNVVLESVRFFIISFCKLTFFINDFFSGFINDKLVRGD